MDMAVLTEPFALPTTGSESGWVLEVDGFDPDKLRVNASLFALADGRFGTNGAPLAARPGMHRWVVAANVYVLDGPETHLLTGPIAMQLPYVMADSPHLRRVLDLRTGVLYEEVDTTEGRLASVRFCSLAHPGLMALRALCPTPVKGEPLLPPADDPLLDTGRVDGSMWMRVACDPGGITAAANDVVHAPHLDRIAVYRADPERVPEPASALDDLATATAAGFDTLLSEHRHAWGERWRDADIVIEGDDELQTATRYALFHLMASVTDEGEAAVGARGLTGTSYRGHVFWDADTFTLPFLAATHPASARAMLEYRIRRLPMARAHAAANGRDGARFPWESARTGEDVTPTSARDRAGHIVPIRTGQLEEHIVAQVAWAASCYSDWTGDEEFINGPGREVLVDTARYWASRVRMEPEGGHIYGVIGPDEYHEPVDDNAFTNIIARWNLRAAADAVERTGGAETDEVPRWRAVADALVDGYDADTGIYEQFAGFFKLEPLIIEEVAPKRPIAADLWLGASRVHGAQVLKQADVLMLHHLVPDAVEPDSLEANLRYYEPRTAHGSSLSPGVHASLFARTGDYGHALEALHIASRIDLDDLTDTTAGGLHLATMGSLWQAFAFGFGGLRPRDGRLVIDPRLPHEWGALELTVRFRGSRVHVRIEHGTLLVDADRPAPITIDTTPYTVDPTGLELARRGRNWEVIT
jgi:trehalose/maltose hydrolase-like predicted phosphorylase